MTKFIGTFVIVGIVGGALVSKFVSETAGGVVFLLSIPLAVVVAMKP